MEITLQNEFVRAVISQQAAEVISFKRLDNGIETIWCRDPAFWFNCNPILFPYTGPLKEGRYTFEGKTYELGQHGFARRSWFAIKDHDETSATLYLKENEETLKVYPFPFTLTVHYRLEGYKIVISYTVENTGNRDLPFDIGFHPAFNCPLTPDKTYDDYCIVFPQEENLHHPEKAIPDGNHFSVAQFVAEGSFFYNDNQIKSEYVDLTDGVHTVRVGKKGFNTIGFWRKNTETPFMCIEPWAPANDLKKAAFFRDDKLVNLLPAGQKLDCEYYFELVK
ncbi:MAG: hypothetical protein IJS38_04280 [Erysipelotrichaceae bacterium]|nr:hypothetical protein [Erysipelotrichaceae bacterium]